MGEALQLARGPFAAGAIFVRAVPFLGVYSPLPIPHCPLPSFHFQQLPLPDSYGICVN